MPILLGRGPAGNEAVRCPRGVHAPQVVASFGTVNLDAWALYRNSEIAMIAADPELAAALRERLFEPDVARSRRGEPPAGMRRILSRVCHRLTYYL